MTPPAIEDYLGDGVYASCDGYTITLDLRGQDHTTRIALEPEVIEALLRFRVYSKLQAEAYVARQVSAKPGGAA